jgi:hypothetical protein
MKYETIPNLTLPKIGFGTWKIGSGSYADPKADSVSMTELSSAPTLTIRDNQRGKTLFLSIVLA